MTTANLLTFQEFHNGYMFASVQTRMSKTGPQHPKPLRLFDIAREDVQPTEREQLHLRECEGCNLIIETFRRQFVPKNPPKNNPGNAA